MIKFFVNKNQIYNFLYLKEPVQLVNYTFSEDYFEFNYKMKDVIINIYNTTATIELATFRKRVRNKWQKLKMKFKKKSN